jgi:hypothetical protein
MTISKEKQWDFQKMGNLKPGVKIIYESPDGGDTVYARYRGETDKWMVGQSTKAKSLIEELREQKLWGEIHRAAKTNPLLKDALDRAIMIYHLGKKDGKE